METNLQVTKETVGESLTVHITGDFNIKTSPSIEDDLKKSMRRQQGSMILRHVNPAVKEIIRLAGFLQVMHIED